MAHTMALTVLRSTGMLSRLGMAYRPFPAGPLTPVEGLQMRGKRVELRYALALDCDDPYGLADDVLLPLETVRAWAAAHGRPQAASWRSTAPRSARSTVSPACSRSGSSTRPGTPDGGVVSRSHRMARRPARLPARARSKGRSNYAPSASPRPGSTRPDPGGRLAVSRRSPTPRSSSRSRRTSDRRSQRTLRRRSAAAPVPSASWPTRPHHHSWTRPRSFNRRGRSAWAVNSSGRLQRERGVELVGHQHGPRVPDVDDPVGQVHGRAEVVAVAQQHRSAGQPDPHVRQEVVVGVGIGQAEADPRRVGHAVDHEHDLVADHLDHPAPRRWSRCRGRSPRSAAPRQRALRRSGAGSGA